MLSVNYIFDGKEYMVHVHGEDSTTIDMLFALHKIARSMGLSEVEVGLLSKKWDIFEEDTTKEV